MKWYKFDPDAWLAGTIGLTLEEKGAYIVILNLLYSRDGNLANDDRRMSVACECRPQTWRRVRASLIAKGKVRITPDGKLDANRVKTEIAAAQLLMNSNQTPSKPDFEKSVSTGFINRINGRTPPQPQPDKTLTESVREKKASNGVPKYSRYWQPEPDTPRADRPTLFDLETRHGKNWGLN